MKDTFIKFHNTIVDYEKNSIRYISPDNYFIVNLQLPTAYICDKSIEDFVKNILTNAKQNFQIQVDNLICGYVGVDRIIFIFSPCIEGNHIFNGDQQRIASFFISHAVLHFQQFITCNIVDLNTQSKVLAYAQHVIFKTHNCFEKTGKYLKYDKTKKTFTTIDEIPNMRAIDEYRAFFFT